MYSTENDELKYQAFESQENTIEDNQAKDEENQTEEDKKNEADLTGVGVYL